VTTAGAPHDSLLTRFLDLAAQQLGRQSSDTGATSPSGVSDRFGFNTINFEDWSEYTRVDQVESVAAASADDVVTLCNNAVKDGYKIRALGHAHNWSPLILQHGTDPNPSVRLIDTSKLVGMSAAVVDGQLHATFGAGTTLEAATQFLEQQDNHGTSAAPGYSFSNMPTVGSLTLGGILAVGGHGTSVPFAAQQEPDLMGCLSNMIVSFKAVTTDPDNPNSHEYAIREFQRTDADASAFLVHLGRAFITEVTLAALPNYYLQLTNLFPNMDDVMAKPTKTPLPGNALASLLDAHGRVEVIWFPYQPLAWVQCNTRFAQTPPKEPSTWVGGPNNYGWMNWITRQESDDFRALFAEYPEYVPDFMVAEAGDALLNMSGTVLNGTARDLEIYLTDNTLRMTAFGYVLQLPRSKVQAAASAFYVGLQNLLASYAKTGQYPVNGAVEIRCTTIDRQAALSVTGAKPPALAATHSVDANDPTLDTVLWVDVLTFPDAPGSAQFFVDLETFTIKTWGAGNPGRLRPEWSKGWAYSTTGPWTNTQLIQSWIPSVYNNATDGLTFDWAKQTLAKYDNANIFSNPFLAKLFS
jgi:FAD/FMN-containing dehydrogenase